MKRKKNVRVGLCLVALLIVLGVAERMLERTAAAQGAKKGQEAPVFQVDPFWPKPLPNAWALGTVIGVSVDAQDHIWILHRPNSLAATQKYASTNPPSAECCKAAPPVLEFDEAGNLLKSWGGPGPGYEWPDSEHGLYVDYKNNIWIGANGPKDAQVLKFAADGKFLMQIGHRGQWGGSNDTANFGQATNFAVDPSTNELYVSDGYVNHRVIVFDNDTGKYKRHWGAYGNRPDDAKQTPYVANQPPAKQFSSTVHCVAIDKDGLVYVCDRTNDRFQVFRKDGTFVKEVFVAPNTTANGTVCDITFSKDPEQRFVYVSDLSNEHLVILDRKTLTVVKQFGSGGRQAGQFDAIHSIAVDSKGNLFTGETFTGQRVQKFLYKGIAAR